MGQLSKDNIRIINGKIIFIPSGSTTLGVSQSADSVAQHYVVTMSGASLSQSVLAPANATASFFYFRTPDTHSFKVFYQNSDRTSVEPTGSIFSLRDLPNSKKSTISASAIQVILPMGISGSNITRYTSRALKSHQFGQNRFTISASGYFTTSFGQGQEPESGSGFYEYLHIINSITGAPIADDINFSHISGSSISYRVQTSGSGALRGIASEGTPDTGSAKVQLRLNETDKDVVETALEDSRSYMNVRDGFYGVSVTNSTTGSNVSLHGGVPLDIGLPIPNPPYIKTNGGFAILMDNAGALDNSEFQIFKDTGIPGVGGTELLKLDNDGNLTVAGTISGSGTFSISAGTITASNLYVDDISAGTITASNLYVDDYIYHNGNTETKIGFPTGDKIDMQVGDVNFFRAWQKDSDTDKFYFSYNNDPIDFIFRTAANNPGLYVSASGKVSIGGHTGNINEALEVIGNISASGNVIASNLYVEGGKVYGNAAYNNYINFNDSSSIFKIQNKTYIKFDGSSGQREVTINEGTNDIDFVVKGESNNPLFHADANTGTIGTNGIGTPLAGLHLGDNLLVTSHITASGNISASAFIYANQIHIDDRKAMHVNSDTLLLNEGGLFSGGVAINRSNLSQPINMYGAVTASGNISSSGIISATGYLGPVDGGSF
jgi:hypothetical protein